MKQLFVPLLCLLALVATTDTRLEAAEFKKAADSCKNAHAIFGWSDFRKIADETEDEFERRRTMPWTKVGWVVGRLNWGRAAGKEMLKVVDSYEPGIVGQAEFKEYSVKGHDNGKAYVAHCGHGGTCNMLAARVANIYKGIGKPTVYCGDHALPKMLVSPVKPTISYPSEEDLNETDADDDDFDMGDDDDEPSVEDF